MQHVCLLGVLFLDEKGDMLHSWKTVVYMDLE